MWVEERVHEADKMQGGEWFREAPIALPSEPEAPRHSSHDGLEGVHLVFHCKGKKVTVA